MIKTSSKSGIYQLKSEQVIHASMDEVWAYFSAPKNLNNLTPEDMGFEITSDILNKTYAGQIITYKIEIIPGFKQNWITEIKYVKDKSRFVDEQRFGPYAMWHHEHHFEALDEHRVLMNDIVSYKLPLGFLGKLVAGRLVKNRVQYIFEYREKKVEEIFNSKA